MVLPWAGPDPLGTPGGTENAAKATDSPDVREADGLIGTYFLVVNQPLELRDRATIERVIRTLGSGGQLTTVALVLQNQGTSVDNDVTTINAADGLEADEVSPGIVLLKIPAAGITQAMLANAIINASKIAAGAVGTTQLANAAVTPAKLDRTYLTSAALSLNPKVTDFAYIGMRTISNSVSNQSVVTVNFVPGVIYDGYVVWEFRAFASGSASIPVNGTFTTNVAGVGQTTNPVQFDAGVDSLIRVRQNYTTAGGSSLTASWGFNWSDGVTLTITGASMVEWDFQPRS